MKKILFGLFIAVLLISTASATLSELGTFKQGDNITIRQLCASCTYNNVSSVIYPNGSIALGETRLIEGSNGEYTTEFNKTLLRGTYTVNGFGDIGGVATAWDYTFEVTGTGNPINENYPFTLGAIIIITFGISVLFIILTEKMEQPGMKVFFMVLCFVFLMIAVGFGIITMQEMNVPETISTGSNILLYSMGWILLVVIAYILIKLTKNALEMYKIKSGLAVDMELPY